MRWSRGAIRMPSPKKYLGNWRHFCTLMGRQPTHIDSLQHVHKTEPLRSVLRKGHGNDRCPFTSLFERSLLRRILRPNNGRYATLGQHQHRSIKKLLAELVPGITELGCHPAKSVDFDTMYAIERVRELAVLCAVQTRDFLAKSRIELSSFNTVSGLCLQRT